MSPPKSCQPFATKPYLLAWFFAGAAALLPGCFGDRNTVTGAIQVTGIEIVILESFPVQVHVQVRGYVPDSCSSVGPVIRERRGTTFHVTLRSIRDPDQVCAQVLTAFEMSVPLDVYGLPAGTYVVNVNGVTDSFTLSVDNRPQQQPF